MELVTLWRSCRTRSLPMDLNSTRTTFGVNFLHRWLIQFLSCHFFGGIKFDVVCNTWELFERKLQMNNNDTPNTFGLSFFHRYKISFLNIACFSLFFISLQELENPKASLTENDLIPLNKFKRNKLMLFSEMPRNQRNTLDDSLEEN